MGALGPSKSYRKLRVRAGFWSSSGLPSNWIEVFQSLRAGSQTRASGHNIYQSFKSFTGSVANPQISSWFIFLNSIKVSLAPRPNSQKGDNWVSKPIGTHSPSKVSGSCRFVIRVRLANLSLRLNWPDFSSQKRPLVWSPHIRIFNMRWGELYYGKSVQNIYG